MSWWIYGRDKDGRPHVWQVDVDPLLILIVIGLLVGLILPNMIRRPSRVAAGALALTVAGLGCITAAKTSLWRQGIWTSWGPRRMTRGYATLYRWGWAGIGVGIVFLFLTWRLTV